MTDILARPIAIDNNERITSFANEAHKTHLNSSNATFLILLITSVAVSILLLLLAYIGIKHRQYVKKSRTNDYSPTIFGSDLHSSAAFNYLPTIIANPLDPDDLVCVQNRQAIAGKSKGSTVVSSGIFTSTVETYCTITLKSPIKFNDNDLYST